MGKILIIDDEPGIRSVLTDILEDEKHTVISAEDGLEGLSILRSDAVDLVVLDVWLPKMGGIDVLKKIKEEFSEMEVIIISGHANIDIAVKAVKLGAFDFVEKPLSLEKIVTIVNNALRMESLKKENLTLKHTIFMEDSFVGKSDAVKKIWEIIKQSAVSDAKVLILGENGTGKELIAREIHRRSLRRDHPFQEVNCAAIPESLIESELFGHEKGAFTGAVTSRKGKFELAHRGTLFLDEIADMSLNAQAKVLRAVQEMRFERIGAEKSIEVDVRIVAATNKDIHQLIREKKFREDLYFRLNVVPIHVPPLRERGDDIEILIEYFMKKYKPEGIETSKTMSAEGLAFLKQYSWPGNIRELKNFIERINIMTDEEEISESTAEHFLGENKRSGVPDLLKPFEDMKLNEARDVFEKMLLMQRLKDHENNISRTAENLGVYPSNLHGKIKKYGIQVKK